MKPTEPEQHQNTSPPNTSQPTPTPNSTPTPKQTPYYTFSFNSYHSSHYNQHKKTYLNRLRIKSKYLFYFGVTLFVVGNIYPLMMWFQYDINVRRPRVSQYLLNRLN